MTPGMFWHLKTVAVTDGTNSDEIGDLLRQGWEPFAVTQSGPGQNTRYHLRRLEPEDVSENWAQWFAPYASQ